MLLVVNKGRSTHCIDIVDYMVKIAAVDTWDEKKQTHIEDLDEMLVYFVEGRELSGAVRMSHWDWIYVLMPELIIQKPLSNANWIKRPE